MNQVPCEHRWRIVLLLVLDDDKCKLLERCEKCGQDRYRRVTEQLAAAIARGFGFDTTVT